MVVATPVLNLRVDAVTRERWEAAAKRAGLTLSEYIRKATDAAADGGLFRPPGPPPPVLCDAQPRDVAARTVAVPGTSAVAGGKVFRGMDPRVKGPKVEQEPSRRRRR